MFGFPNQVTKDANVEKTVEEIHKEFGSKAAVAPVTESQAHYLHFCTCPCMLSPLVSRLWLAVFTVRLH